MRETEKKREKEREWLTELMLCFLPLGPGAFFQCVEGFSGSDPYTDTVEREP